MSFSDPRNEAELLLSPARPTKRSVVNFETLKLNFGSNTSAVSMPGAISSTKDITGSVRSSLGSTILARQQVHSLTAQLTTTLIDFDAHKVQFETGNLITPDPIFDQPTNGIPSAAGFFRFSALRPGQAIPPSYAATIVERKQQLQSFTARIASSFSAPKLGGLNITENTQKQPYPHIEDLDIPTVPRLAQGGSIAQQDDALKDKRRFTVTGVHVASGKPRWWSRLTSMAHVKAMPTLNPVTNQIFRDRTNAKSWSEPTSPYAAQFPHNKVQQTESGHIFEWDDTPGAERIHIFHRAGSFIEWHPNGTVVYKNLRDGYDITMGDKFVKVGGSCHISVDGNATLYAKGSVDVQTDGEFNVNAKKDFNVFAENINLRAKKKFKVDGTSVDLRYIQLPTGLVPIPMTGALSPRINIGAIVADFPKSNIKTVLAAMAKAPLDPKMVNAVIKLNPQPVPAPVENPLSNPAIYTKKTPKAVSYRARLFDTPEETDNYELYTSHVSLQKSLGDISGDPRELGGKLTEPNIIVPAAETKPTINYLDFDTFKGRFSYPNDYRLANTSFTLKDLVDLSLHPDVSTPLKPAPLPMVDPYDPTDTIPTDNGLGNGSGRTGEDEEEDENAPWNNRLDVVKSVNYDFPGLIVSDPEGFVDQVAHRLNRIDGHTKWGRKARNADGSNLNEDALTYQLDPNDYSKKKMIDIIGSAGASDAHPTWQLRPSWEEPGNGYWAPPVSASRD